MAMAELTPGTRRTVGRYQLEGELGRGSMGVVYRALDPTLGRPIALKTILVDHLGSETRASFERRFLAEARIAARLSHPGIVVVHDFGRDPKSGLLFIALECLSGETLAHKLAQGTLPAWRDALRIVGRVAAALHHAHQQGVVHRDVKPANVMILPSGEPKIMDFGIAHAEQVGAETESGGTPLYMSPEQALGEAVDGRSDLFSLGAIAYALLTGRPPFRGDSVRAILARVAYRHPSWPSELVSGLPKDVDRMVARAMMKAPADRYQSGLELAGDIDDVLAGQPPSHCAGFAAPERGSGTIPSSASGVLEEVEDLPLEELEKSVAWPPRMARRRERVSQSRVPVLLGTLALALAAYLYGNPEPIEYWRLTLRPVVRSVWASWIARPSRQLPEVVAPLPTSSPGVGETPAPAPAQAGPTPNQVATAPEGVEAALETSGSRGLSQTQQASPLASPPAADAEAGSPAVQGGGAPPSPRAEPVPAGQPSSSPSPPAPGPAPSARLGVEFEHRLKAGTLRLWVDGEPKLTQKLSSKVQRRVLVFETRKGRVAKQLALTPGTHEIRARVDWGGHTTTGRLRGRFARGQTRLLDIELKDGALRMTWR